MRCLGKKDLKGSERASCPILPKVPAKKTAPTEYSAELAGEWEVQQDPPRVLVLLGLRSHAGRLLRDRHLALLLGHVELHGPNVQRRMKTSPSRHEFQKRRPLR